MGYSMRGPGRGSKDVNHREYSNAPLRDRHELLVSAHSKSTKNNISMARKVLAKYSGAKNQPDPTIVTKESSVFVLNLLADYCKFGTPNCLRNDSMSALIQGLRFVYSENGHYQSWTVDENGIARGNPLINNPDLDQLRRAHRVHLARYGVISLKARPITAHMVCDHAERFWYGCGRALDVRDIMLHSIFVLGLNLGLRFDEINKLKVEHVSVTSDGVIITMTEAIKNSTVQRNYRLREWDGNTAMRQSVFNGSIRCTFYLVINFEFNKWSAFL